MEELDLKELFNMFWMKKIHIGIIVAIFAIVGLVYSYIFVSPVYTSYTSLVLATSGDESNASKEISTADITINNNLVSTYSEIVKSKKIIRKVIENLGLNKSENAIKKSVSVSSVKSTQLIQINVTDENPTQAKMIADEMAKVFSAEITELYNMNNVHILDEAEVPTSPSNINHIKDIAIFGFIGLVIAAGYVLIANMLDTTVKNKEDVEKKLGLTVLAEIPLINNFDETTKKSSSRGGRK